MNREDEAFLLSGAYALDALTPEEAAAVEAAMRESEELRGEVVGLLDTAVTLGLAVPPVSPPPALRASILQAIDETPQLPVQEEDVGATPAPVQHLAPRRRRRQVLRRPAVLLSAAAVAALLFGGGVLVTSAVMEPRLEYSRIAAAADEQEQSADVIGGGVATVAWSRSEDATSVTITGVDVPEGQVLQLWTVDDGVATSAGLYEPADDAQYALLHQVPAVGEMLAVSVEPAGGSAQPSRVVASVRLRA